MATSTKTKWSNGPSTKNHYYPDKPPSTASPKAKHRSTGAKLQRIAPVSSRRTKSYELDRSSKRNPKLADSKTTPQVSNKDVNYRSIKNKVLQELKDSNNDESNLRKRGHSYPSEHGTIPQNMDIMKKETTLVVLEYLSSLPPEKLRARNRDVAKSKTVHIMGGDRPVTPLRRKSKLYRSSSDAGEHFEEARKKFKEMAVPLKRQLSTNVIDEIKTFEKAALKKSLNLNLAKQRPPSPGIVQHCMSPESLVVSRLEDLSEHIMKDFPQLLDEPISDILTPLDDGNTLTYESFAKVAKVVFEKNVSRFSGTLWSRIALVFYLVREIVYLGNLNDLQLELIVEYSAKFVTENSHSFIKKQGGWGALELEDDILVANGSLFDHSGYEQAPKLTRQDELSFDNDNNHHDSAPTISTFVNKWMSYGVAVAAIGLGVAYSFMKH